MPQPRWGDVRRFCLVQGYAETRTDHYRYIKRLSDGSSSGTMASFGKDDLSIPAGMWLRVWKRQLRLASEDEFWEGLDGKPVSFDVPPVLEVRPLPPYLVRFLRDELHYSDERIAKTDAAEAQQLVNRHYSRDITEP